MFSRETSLRTLLPAAEVGDDYVEPIELMPLHAPALTGTPLKLFLAVAEGPLAGPVRRRLMRRNGVPQALEECFIPEHPTFRPNTAGWRAEDTSGGELVRLDGDEAASAADRAAAAAALAPAFAGSKGKGQLRAGARAGSSGGAAWRAHTAADFHRAYAAGALTPSDVAENVIAAVAASEAQSPPMRFLVAHDPKHLRAAAAASSERWRSGKPLSPLDGVPFAVKDCVDALPYPTTGGTAFMAGWRTPVASLAGVQALLDAGALLVGKTTLHEIGLGTTGLNLATGTARNAHSPAHHTGGSSSGSAAAVAAGLCPFAVGTDGGGSVRIPAAACGVVGLKPTHERVGTEVGLPPIDQTVCVVGPLGGSVQDCALMYALMANTGQAEGTPAPSLVLPNLQSTALIAGERPLAGKRAGVCWKWFDDAAPPVAAACRAALRLLEARGLEVVEVGVPELALLRAAHSCTITSEMRNNMTAALQDGPTRRRMNAETRLSLAVAAGFEAAHYLQAQKIRTRIDTHFRRAFERCGFIVTPSLPCTAPPIKPAALVGGETDLGTTTSLMHYMLAANMVGIPAITVPVGAVPSTHAAGVAGAPPAAASPSDAGGSGSGGGGGPLLPVGLQLMAPCWHEGSLLHAASLLEAAVKSAGSSLGRPAVWYDVLAPRQRAS